MNVHLKTLIFILSLTSGCSQEPDNAMQECTECSAKYPYYNASHLQTSVQKIEFFKSLQEAKMSVLGDIKKVFVFPVTSRRNTVVGFIDEFLIELERRGWKILDSDKPDVDDKLKNSNAEIIVFYMTDMSHQNPRKKWELSENQSAVKIYISEDLQSIANKNANKFFAEHADSILVRYPEAFTQLVPKPKASVYWFPHFAGQDYLKAYTRNKEKVPKVFLSGSLNPNWYPLRIKALELLNEKNNHLVQHYLHVGYDQQIDPAKQRHDYAASMSATKIGLTGAGLGPSLLAPYLVAKHFEIPATGSVMVTDKFVVPLMKRLGFEEGIHYLASSPETLAIDLANWLLPENTENLEKIGSAGNLLVKEHHSIERRMMEFEAVVYSTWARKRSVHFNDIEMIWLQEKMRLGDLKKELFSNLPKTRILEEKMESKIPLLSHLVWLTNPSKPVEFREEDFNRLEKKISLFKQGKYQWKFFLWTNADEKSLPKTYQKCADLGVEVRSIESLDASLIKVAKTLVGNKKIGAASDIVRVILLEQEGGIYSDNDYSFHANMDIWIGNFNSVFGFYDHSIPFLGNAFMAASPRHPVLRELKELLVRNIFGTSGGRKVSVPFYITHPKDFVSQTVMTTGPVALTIAVQKAINLDGNEDLVLPHGVLFMSPSTPLGVIRNAYQQASLLFCERKESSGDWQLSNNCLNPLSLKAMGNDTFGGSWVAPEQHTPTIFFPLPLLSEEL